MNRIVTISLFLAGALWAGTGSLHAQVSSESWLPSESGLFKEERAAHEKLDAYNHRPIYHFTTPKNRLNDPNGLCWWKGNWHLFYQVYEVPDEGHHWGHAVSKDLIHWQDLPGAIYPGPEEKVYSGTTYVEEDRVIAAYYGKPIGEMIAVASDSLLLDWKKIGGKPVIDSPTDDNVMYKIFDPCLWKTGEYYYMLSGSTQSTGPDGRLVPAEYLFRSRNLKDWEYRHPFVVDDRFSKVGDDGACPYFLPIGKDRHLLIHFSHKSGAKYLVGRYDTGNELFHVTDGGFINNGPVGLGGVHAPSACSIGNGEVVAIYNTKSNNYIKGTFNECMTLPQLLTVDENDRLVTRPYGDYESLRYNHVSLHGIELPFRQEVEIPQIKGNAMEIDLVFNDATKDVAIDVLTDPDKKEYTRIIFRRGRGFADRSRVGGGDNAKSSVIEIDPTFCCSRPGFSSRVPELKEFPMDKNEPLKLKIFIDRSIVEVFVNDRQWAMLRVWPVLESSTGFRVTALAEDSRIERLDAWQMKGIFE